MEQDFRKFPDEDKIEVVLDRLHSAAWNDTQLDNEGILRIIDELTWVLAIWNKTLGSTKLFDVVRPYLQASSDSSPNDTTQSLRRLDLLICFFHHYIYAFEEFENRKFRHSVIRCGLICERIVKRLAVASNHHEILDIPNFDKRANSLMSILEGKILDIDFLVVSARFIYSRRSRMGAHDTGAPSVFIAKPVFLRYQTCTCSILMLWRA